MKKYVAFLVVLCGVFVANAQVNVTVGPYLQSPAPTSIKVMWRTDSACNVKVMYGTDKANLNQTALGGTDSTRHTVLLTGLQPYTEYFYAIYNNNVFAEGGDTLHKFKTFPVSTDPGHVRVWAIGDFGKGNNKEQRVRDSYPFDTVETSLWLWLGDNVYENGTEEEYLTKVFDSVWGYKKLMKYTPFEPCPGNHDYGVISPPQSTKPPLTHTGPYYDLVEVYRNAEAGGVATNHELYYSYDYRNVHFICLNSELGSPSSAADNWTGVSIGANTFTSSPMSQWLIQDLTANTKQWVVAYWHQTPYTDGSHKSSDFYEIYMKAMRENYCKILEQYGVDLVVCGHSHVYERSYLVHGCYGNEGSIGPANFVQQTSGMESLNEAYVKYTDGASPNYGTVYVNCGNGGSDYGTPDFQHPYMFTHYGCDGCVGSFVLDVDSNKLVGRHIDWTHTTRDEFTMYKKSSFTGIENIKEPAVADLKVIPNPFGDVATIYFALSKNEKVTMDLADANGKTVQVFNGNLAKGNQEITLDSQRLKLAKGVYSLRILAGTESITRKLVLQ